MDILIIGGTKFLGRALSEEIVRREHNLTLFHRGKTNPEFLPDIPRIIGDRETDIEKITGSYDAVIDTCGYYPRIVKASTEYLKDKTSQYVFISTISVYEETTEIEIDENAEIHELDDPTTEDMESEENAYGGLKALCENVVLDDFGSNRSLIIRPGLIVGPHDPTNRFTYWPVRIRKEDDILGPGDGSFPLQFIDVRDLADFIIDMVEKEVNQTFNVTGPVKPIKLKNLFSKIQETLGTEANIHWAENEWLIKHDVSPWMEMPLWIPSKEGEALMQVDISNAKAKGLKFRSIATTINDTLQWYDEINGDDKEWPAGLSSTKEKELLKKLSK